MKKLDKYNIQIIAIVLCTIIGVICAIWLIVYLLRNNNAQKEAENLKESYVVEEVPEITPEVTLPPQPITTEQPIEEPQGTMIDGRMYPDFTGLDVPGLKIDFQNMQKEKNPHIYGWITIPGTSVDYPIVQHPEDNAYYLNHDLAGNEAAAGSIYTENYNNKDFNDNLTVIYGHNMKNGTMFKTLHYYTEQEFFEGHPYIYVYTETQTKVYQIFAAYEYSDTHLLLNRDMENEAEFRKYLNELKGLSESVGNYNWDLNVSEKDKVITLSTCIANKPEKRYLVQAKLIAAE